MPNQETINSDRASHKYINTEQTPLLYSTNDITSLVMKHLKKTTKLSEYQGPHIFISEFSQGLKDQEQ